MKLALASLLSLFTFSAFAAGISQTTLDRVARDIDNSCGDTYCEGDYNWYHSDLKCNLKQGQCTLEMELIDHIYADDMSTFEEVIYAKTCIINDMFTIKDIVSARGSYSDKLMDGVYRCVGDMEVEYQQLK